MAPSFNIPFVPDYDEVIAQLLERVTTLETNLTEARSATAKRFYVQSMPAGITDVDLSEQGVTYTPGTNSLIFWGNTVKQVLGESYIELDSTHIRLTDPTEGGETFEILALPFPIGNNVDPD